MITVLAANILKHVLSWQLALGAGIVDWSKLPEFCRKVAAFHAAPMKMVRPERVAAENEFEVAVAADGRLSFEGEPVDLAVLGEKLSALAKDKDDIAILISADPQATYSRVVDVLDLCTKAKIDNVVFSVAHPEGGETPAPAGDSPPTGEGE